MVGTMRALYAIEQASPLSAQPAIAILRAQERFWMAPSRKSPGTTPLASLARVTLSPRNRHGCAASHCMQLERNIRRRCLLQRSARLIKNKRSSPRTMCSAWAIPSSEEEWMPVGKSAGV